MELYYDQGHKGCIIWGMHLKKRKKRLVRHVGVRILYIRKRFNQRSRITNGLVVHHCAMRLRKAVFPRVIK